MKDLVRVNKSFIVERGLPMRQMLIASKRLAEYMHFAIKEKHENIWMAPARRPCQGFQRPNTGSSPQDDVDGWRRFHRRPFGTAPYRSIINLLRVRPVRLSQGSGEFQFKRDVEGWKKGAQDDIVSMQTGIMGYKGHIHYHCAPCIDDFLHGLDINMPKSDLYRKIALHLDHEIHRNYRLYPSNYIALDELKGTSQYSEKYKPEDKVFFDKYVAGQLAKIEIPNKDEAYLRERILNVRQSGNQFSCRSMKYIGLTLIIVLFTACTVDNYDTGDGKYSYMRADFVMAHTPPPAK